MKYIKELLDRGFDSLKKSTSLREAKDSINSALGIEGLFKFKARSWDVFLKKIKDLETLRNRLNIAFGNGYFLSDEHEYIFILNKLDGEQRKKLLNVTSIHYIDKKIANEWRKRIIQKIHPDKCMVFGAEEACAVLDRMHKDMIRR